MLVLSRYVGQSIFIDVAGGIRITIVQVKGKQVRIGIKLDESIVVLREELEGGETA